MVGLDNNLLGTIPLPSDFGSFHSIDKNGDSQRQKVIFPESHSSCSQS